MPHKAKIEFYSERSALIHPKLDKRQFEEFKEKVSETNEPARFKRPVDLVSPLFSIASVRRVLSITDRELNKCARACKAEVVPHKWGYTNGYMNELAAEVDYISSSIEIDPCNPTDSFLDNLPTEVGEQMLKGLSRYNSPISRLRRQRLNDMDYYQFVYGINSCDQTQVQPKLFLVDIEPLFRGRPGGCY